jgi:hypothetical protein
MRKPRDRAETNPPDRRTREAIRRHLRAVHDVLEAAEELKKANDGLLCAAARHRDLQALPREEGPGRDESEEARNA